MAIFEKRIGAPAGDISITTDGATYVINDTDATTVTVTDIEDISTLAAHPYVQLQGGTGGPYTPPPVVSQVYLKNGQLTDTRTGNPVAVSGGGGTAVVDLTAAPYNVDTTGATDAAPAVQAAITSLGLQGGDIMLPKGTLLFNTTPIIPVNLTGRIRIRGVRDATVIKVTGNSIRAFKHAAASGSDVIGNVTFEDFTVDCNNVGNSQVGDHIVFGTHVNGAITAQGQDVVNVHAKNINVINVPNVTGNQQGRAAFALRIWHQDINQTMNRMTGHRFDNITQNGGNAVIIALAQSPSSLPANVYHDDIEVRNIRLTNTNRPSAPFFAAASTVHIGSAGWGKRILVENVYTEGSCDNTIEINNVTNATIRNIMSVDSYNPGTLISNFVAAGDSYPVCTKLNGALSSGATVAVVDSTSGWAVGDNLVFDGDDVRTIQSIDSATQVTLTKGVGRIYNDRVVVYRVGNMQAQRFVLSNIIGRRTTTGLLSTGALLIQNISNTIPMGHVEVDGVAFYSNGGTLSGTTQNGDVFKCRTGTTSSPSGDPISLIVRNVKCRIENLLSQTSSTTTTVAPIQLTMRGGVYGRSRVTIRDYELAINGTTQGSGKIGVSGILASTTVADLDVDGYTYDSNIPTTTVAGKLFDLHSDSLGSRSWRLRNCVVKRAIDASSGAKAINVRMVSAYCRSDLRPAITADAAIGATTLTFASTAGFAVGQKIGVGVEASSNSEIHTIKALTGTTITIASSTGPTTARTNGVTLVSPVLQMSLADSDLSGLGVGSGSGVLSPSDVNVLGAVRVRNVVAPKPPTPATLTVPASGVEQLIADGYDDGEVFFSGGAGVTALDWTNDGGANWYNVVTQAAGTLTHRLRIRTGEHYRVTYATTAPTAKRVVPSR